MPHNNKSDYRHCEASLNSYISSAVDYPPNDVVSCLTASNSVSNTTFTNQLCINFTNHGDSPSKTVKCKSFWRTVGTTPGLGALMAVGKQWGAGKDVDMPPSPPPDTRRPWLHQLLQFKSLNLHQVALAGVQGRPPGAGGSRVLAYAIETTPAEVMADIAAFEAELERREAERDPNQTVLGYRDKQPPPRIAN